MKFRKRELIALGAIAKADDLQDKDQANVTRQDDELLVTGPRGLRWRIFRKGRSTEPEHHGAVDPLYMPTRGQVRRARIRRRRNG